MEGRVWVGVHVGVDEGVHLGMGGGGGECPSAPCKVLETRTAHSVEAGVQGQGAADPVLGGRRPPSVEGIPPQDLSLN